MSTRKSIAMLASLLLSGTALADSMSLFNYTNFKETDPTLPETFHCTISGATEETVVRANTFYEAVGGFSTVGQAGIPPSVLNSSYFVGQHDPLYRNEGAYVLFQGFTPDSQQPANVSIDCESGAGDRQFAFGFG
ncbi:MAG: hypothetical protein K0R66_36 [Gammaproteobacteria bacterium]|jgi:hypothetical protein|nr:hypothetical protein [Gammaproteobacteria bacterium]